jgi:steroid delta-isomerase
MDYQTATSLCETYLNALVNNDVDTIVNLYASDATVEDPVGSEVMIGEEAIRGFYTGAIGGIAAAQLSGPPRLAGNEIAFPFTLVAGAPGQQFEMSIIDVFVVNEEGKVSSMRAFWGGENMKKLD